MTKKEEEVLTVIRSLLYEDGEISYANWLGEYIIKTRNHDESIRISKRKYKAKHKEQILKQRREYYQQHGEEIRQRQREYYQSHKEQVKAYYQRKKENQNDSI